MHLTKPDLVQPDLVQLRGLPTVHRGDVRDLSPAFRYDVALVGLGYVGLPTALTFHAARCRVLGLDVSPQRLEAIRTERVDLLDSDRRRLRLALDDDDFVLTKDVSRLQEASVVIIAVPTPVDDHLLPDLSILRGACASVVANAVRGQVVILSSTTYVGSTQDLLVGPLVERGLVIGRDVYVAFSPERIDPGNDHDAHEDVARVVGGVSKECARRAMTALGSYAANLYEVSSAQAAEMTKLVENTFRAVNIALANELAEVSRALGLDVAEVIDAAATKPYGFMPFFPGPGVGGHCIPCDPHYLLWQLRAERLSTPVIEQAMAAIAKRPLRVVERVCQVLSLAGRGIHGARVLVLGVSYKPDVEDLRGSPALEILAGLHHLGAETAFHDPLMSSLRLPAGEVLTGVEDPARYEPDLVVVHTLHRCLDLSWLEDVPLVLDTSYRLRDLPQRFTP
jgi:UDP-N-acetyl-D-glucosamine dehydrogenase